MSSTAFSQQRQLFGHPIGLYILFMTELWERFSYYGMRAILVLYMVQSATDETNPGLGWDNTNALALYGWYTMLVYVASIPGGILADKFIGQKRSVLVGGILLVAGHGILAVEAVWAFYTGLGLIILGVGALKPNISTMVGGLYKKGDERRDQGFYIFYIGINVGAFLSSLIVSVVAAVYGWHYGFGLAGIGMAVGLLVYILGQPYIKEVGNAPLKASENEDENATSLGELFGRLLKSPLHLGITLLLAIGSVAFAVLYMGHGDAEAAVFAGLDIEQLAYSLLFLFLSIVVGILMMVYQDIEGIEKDRFIVLILSYLIVIVFWGAFEQAGGLMNIYTNDKIDRFIPLWMVDAFFIAGAGALIAKGIADLRKKRDTASLFFILGAIVAGFYGYLKFASGLEDPYEVPTGVFQSVNAFFIMVFATVIGAFWIWWQRSGRESSSLFKMALGTIIMGVGFLFMAQASWQIEEYGDKAALILLILAYLFHTLGELCASPVALSFITKVAPVKYVALMMGVYFAATGLGNKVAGSIGEASQAEPIEITLDATPKQLASYIEDDSTLIKGLNFELVSAAYLENGEVVLKTDKERVNDFVEFESDSSKKTDSYELMKGYLEISNIAQRSP